MNRIATTMTRAATAALLLAAAMAPAHAAEAGVQVLVLGTYHFANPGRDIVNTKVDDVLQPHRQAELEALTAQLARFAPTKVMVERDADQHEGQRLPSYDAWRAGGRREVRNEVEQVGFRLASAMKHEAVYGIDADGDFPFEAVQAWAKKNGAEALLHAQLDEIKQRSKADEGPVPPHHLRDAGRLQRPRAHPARPSVQHPGPALRPRRRAARPMDAAQRALVRPHGPARPPGRPHRRALRRGAQPSAAAMRQGTAGVDVGGGGGLFAVRGGCTQPVSGLGGRSTATRHGQRTTLLFQAWHGED
jgi:hypothetical protein